MDGVTILDLLQLGVGVAALVYVVFRFERGEYVPRKVWNDMATHIIKETVVQVLTELGIPGEGEGMPSDKA